MGILVFDFDGVVSVGICPPKKDAVIITGRGFDECDIVYEHLLRRCGYLVPVYFNPHTISFGRTRENSAVHKANIISFFISVGHSIDVIFEDDQWQIEVMKGKLGATCPKICRIDSYWVNK